MAMRLDGSCHCGAVRFSLDSETPYPFMHCYCSICRKTAGGGGYAINIMGRAETLQVRGKDKLSVYQARMGDELSPCRRHFCRVCGSALWISDPRWPDWVYPQASAIDTPLPRPPELVHLMLKFAAPWVEVPEGHGSAVFQEYPDISIEDWHRQRGLHGDP